MARRKKNGIRVIAVVVFLKAVYFRHMYPVGKNAIK